MKTINQITEDIQFFADDISDKLYWKITGKSKLPSEIEQMVRDMIICKMKKDGWVKKGN